MGKELNKYIILCPICYYFDEKYGDCDMCGAGGISAIDNNGKKPSEVQDCSIFCITIPKQQHLKFYTYMENELIKIKKANIGLSSGYIEGFEDAVECAIEYLKITK